MSFLIALRTALAVVARFDHGFQAIRVNAIDEMDRPSPGVAVDGEGNFRIGGSMFDRISQDEKLGSKMGDIQDVAVHRKTHLHIGRMSGAVSIGSIHEYRPPDCLSC